MAMRRIIAISICIAAAAVAAAYAERYTAVSSSITIRGTSTLHDWQVAGETINGKIEGPPLAGWKDGSAVVKVAIPVKSIKADHERMTRIMQEALKEAQNPEITYELTGASLQTSSADAFTVRARGRLTIAGVTREIDMSVDGKRLTPATYALTGSTPIRMTDYGIKPPITMMNTLKTGNDVTVSFRWVVHTAGK